MTDVQLLTIPAKRYIARIRHSTDDGIPYANPWIIREWSSRAGRFPRAGAHQDLAPMLPHGLRSAKIVFPIALADDVFMWIVSGGAHGRAMVAASLALVAAEYICMDDSGHYSELLDIQGGSASRIVADLPESLLELRI
jgi:hypothetical protein